MSCHPICHRLFRCLLSFVTLVALPFGCGSSAQAVEAATLVLRGGKVATLDDEKPFAQAIAVRDRRIVAVGSNSEIAAWIDDSTEVIELSGRFVVPGFIEGHGHFLGLGEMKMDLDLSETRSWEEIVSLVQKTAETTPRGRWIVGRGWHQSKWDDLPDDAVAGYPHHADLSRVTPHHPLLLTHASGHMCLANRAAMTAAGVNRSSTSPRGGEILKTRDGEPSGVFRETAMAAIRAAHGQSERQRTAAEVEADFRTAIEFATQECLRYGVCSFHDAGASFETVDRYVELADKEKLSVRLYVMLRANNAELSRRLPSYRMVGRGHHFLTVRSIKCMFDGALGTHGAWLFLPYDDLPNSTGHNIMSVEALRETAALAVEHDFQVCVHAIGDRANHEVLNVFANAPRRQTDHRWRIEHAQHLAAEDIPRFAELGVIASMQGIHATSDAPFVVQRLGMRRSREGAYAWQSLLKSGARIVNGTDAPVERINPLSCFHASVTRRLPNGVEFFPEQRMTREQALRSYTRDAAYAAFEEDLKGTLTPGKLADIVVLSQDILTVADERLPQTKVDYTIVDGVVRYRRR